MKNLSKLTALLSAAAMTLSLAACSGGNAASTPAPADTSTPTDTAAPSEGAPYPVGICQLGTHDALDAATQGFLDALNEALPGRVEFDVQNAAGDSNTCSTIVNSFVADGVDLILANATPALQAATAATADIPILGTSVTEYGVAALKGQTLRQRARNLIEIAHPDFRDELKAEYEKRFHCKY